MNWYLKVVRDNYANFSGRASRVEYWMFSLMSVVIGTVLGIVETVVGSPGYLSLIYVLILIIPSMAVTFRRLHDVNKTAWLLLIAPTGIGLIPLCIWSISGGTQGDNDYGPSPREIDGPEPAAEDETGQAESEETDEEA